MTGGESVSFDAMESTGMASSRELGCGRPRSSFGNILNADVGDATSAGGAGEVSIEGFALESETTDELPYRRRSGASTHGAIFFAYEQATRAGNIPVKAFCVGCSVGSKARTGPPAGSSSSAGRTSSIRRGGDLDRPFPAAGLLTANRLGPGARGTFRPSSVTASGLKEIRRPRCLRLAWRASISACRCSDLPAEKARQETPEPLCLRFSTCFTSSWGFDTLPFSSGVEIALSESRLPRLP